MPSSALHQKTGCASLQIWRHATRGLTAFLVDTMGRLSQLIEEDERKRQIQSAPVLELGLAPR